MPIITREDGVNFAVYTYRETLSAKNATLLKQEIHILQQENGDFARFFKTLEGDIEAVFSRDEGYLLGESIWAHFDEPYDFIFCEPLPNTEEAILIVARAGRIYLDSKIPVVNLPDELLALIGGDNHYQIYIYGDLPLAEEADDTHFAFDKEKVKSFTVLKESMLSTLKVDEGFALLPVPEAIDDLGLAKSKLPIYIVVGIAALGIGYYIYGKVTAPPPAPVVVQRPTAPQDPYQAYKSVLRSPSPSELLKDFALNVQQMYTLPGWEIGSIKYQSGTTTVSLKSVGGNIESLLKWVKVTNSNLETQGGKASIVISSKAKDRDPPEAIYNSREMVSVIYDRMKFTLPTGTISISKTTEEQSYQETDVSVSFNQISTDIIMLFARELYGLPVILDDIDANVSDGLLSGSLQFKVLGAN